MTVVRLSRGSFPPEAGRAVASRLERSRESLMPAISSLSGLISYYVGIEPGAHSMINVSMWASVEDAEQMSTLPEMLALASEFIGLGVQFERPILNYTTLWEMPPSEA